MFVLWVVCLFVVCFVWGIFWGEAAQVVVDGD